MDQEKFWKVGGNDSNLDFSRRWKLSSSVNKRTVNRWHLGNFCSILAWKYIFSLSFLFPHSFASSFLCKFRAKISLQDRSWAMKMMKLDWPSCLSLSLFLSYRLSFERMNERLERGSLRFSELTFPRHPWNCESIALVTVIIRFVPLTLRDCFIRIILIIDIPSFFFFDINSSNNFNFLSTQKYSLSLSLSLTSRIKRR